MNYVRYHINITFFTGRQSTMSLRKECYIYSFIPNVPFLQQISTPRDVAVWHYINITFFTGWHCRLSPRGNIVDRGGADRSRQCFQRGDNIPCQTVKSVIFILLYRMSHFYNKFHRRETLPCDIQNCHLENQSDCWNLTWGIIIKMSPGQLTNQITGI